MLEKSAALRKRKSNVRNRTFFAHGTRVSFGVLDIFWYEKSQSCYVERCAFVACMRYILAGDNKKKAACTVFVTKSRKVFKWCTVKETPVESSISKSVRRCPTKSSSRPVAAWFRAKLSFPQRRPRDYTFSSLTSSTRRVLTVLPIQEKTTILKTI